MSKVLVAGGAGFIGSHICKDLLKKGYTVICVDNFITGNKKNIEEFLSNPAFAFVEEDITSQKFLDNFKEENIEFIFHFASPASPNKNSKRSYINFPIETMLVNSLGTYHLLEVARKNSSTFLYASSSEIYGDPAISPQTETYFGNVNPNGVRSVYDEGKRFGEALVAAYVRKYNVDGRMIRIFNTYGPWMQKDDGRVVSNLINQAIAGEPLTLYGEGKQTRSFCFIDDMMDGLEKALFTENLKGEVINLGNPDERSIKDLALMVQKLTGTSSEIKFEPLPSDDPKIRKPDIEKAKRLLAWEPKITLEEGLVKTIDYFKSIQ